jgi:two-component system, response regulator
MAQEKTRIIIIEDTAADAALIQDALAQFGFEVIHYRDGEEALSVLLNADSSAPDLILLDLNMPKTGGLDILQRIRCTPRLTYTPVGILTGSQAPGDRHRASVIGATRYIHKPIGYDEYVQSVRDGVEDMLQNLAG